MTEKLDGQADPGQSMTDEWLSLVPVRRCNDERGSLLPLEWDSLPFEPRRIFTVSDVPVGTVRGSHGHRSCAQLLVAIVGEIAVQISHGGEYRTIVLTANSPALLVRAGIWFSQTYLSEGAVLLVLASEPYNPTATFEGPEEA